MTPQGVATRPATADDLATIVTIEASCFDPPWSDAVLGEELARPFGRVRLATLGDTVVGFTCTWHVVDEAHLHRIAVAPAWRRLGIARRLLADVRADAAAAGCVHIDLEVAGRNAAALALYASAGYVVVGQRRAYYQHPPDDAVLLRAVIAPLGATPAQP